MSYQENIDTSSPLGSAIFTIISAVAQLERDIIAERVKAGLRRAVENGKKLARIMHRFSSRSGESAGLSALRHARPRPPQAYCRVR